MYFVHFREICCYINCLKMRWNIICFGGILMFIDVNGVKFYYEKSGSGRPLVMVHCNSMDHKIFKPAIRILQNHFTVYNVDSRGHGKSSRVRIFHYEDMTEDMYQFITKLQIDKPVFYGFSDGGIVGLMLASKYPDLLSSLIVSGASLNPDSTKNLPKTFLSWVILFWGPIKWSWCWENPISQTRCCKGSPFRLMSPVSREILLSSLIQSILPIRFQMPN